METSTLRKPISGQQENKRKENESFFQEAMANLSKKVTKSLQGYFQMGRIIDAVVRAHYTLEQISQAQGHRLSAKTVGRYRQYFLYCHSLEQLLGKEIFPVLTFTEYISFKNLPALVKLVHINQINLELTTLQVSFWIFKNVSSLSKAIREISRNYRKE
jgi:hypothetical protein